MHFYTVSETEKIQLCRHNTYTRLKTSPLPIMSTYQNIYIYSSFSLSSLSPIADWHCRMTSIKVKAMPQCLGFTTSMSHCLCHITHKSYMEELSEYWKASKMPK